jgi:hypothetical protein
MGPDDFAGMPKTRSVTTAERAYLEKRLEPVLTALRRDEALRDEFLLYVKERGGSLTLALDRLKTVWWPSRKSMYPGFFVLALVDFGLEHGLYAPTKISAGKSAKRERVSG